VKILILTHRIPFPQNGGYPIVVGNTIRGLVDQGHEVSLVSLNEHKGSGREVTPDPIISKINYREYNIDISISMLGALIKMLGKQSRSVDRYYDPAFERLLIAEVRNNKYDVIQFEGLFVASYLDAVRKNCDAKLIYRAHNIEHQVWERVAMQKHDPIKRWFIRRVANRIKRYELQQLNIFDAVAVFTGQDKNSMDEYGVKNVDIIPVGIDMDHYQPDLSKTEFPSLFFLGSLDWMPNREGIEWFLENFHNDLVNGELRSRFYVAGNDIPDQLFDEYDVMGKIYIQGEVDDALEFVNSKSIMIVPLLSGGGMRVKIVEGMAMQKCIISTTLGAEGMLYTDGVNILIANTREEFFEAIKRCIADEEFCKTIGRNARYMIEDQHDIKDITNRLIAFYERVLDKDVV